MTLHDTTITLANCAHEPIHIPGLIQPHGALLAFDETLSLTGWSTNCYTLLGLEPTLGLHASNLFTDADILTALSETQQTLDDGESAPLAVEIKLQDIIFDVVIHAHLHRIIVEYERRDTPSDEVASFALKAHRAIDRLKRQKSTFALLQIAVEEVRKLTGFDRVMAYIFRHDDSGDVVAEACQPDLDPYLGRRYPASDIPVQARRLYTLNTLRLIADVNYTSVSLVGNSDTPLDMSYCILRSVSPIHIEYLQNMGVGASMSVSIIINGRLWGMLACHHMSPRQIPYSIRMACDVIAQIIASTVASIQERDRAQLAAQSADMRSALMATLLDEDDMLRGLTSHAEALKANLAADALILTQHGKVLIFGDISLNVALNIQDALPTEGDDLVLWQTRQEWPTELQLVINKWVGLLAIKFDPITNGWILALRMEQIETVNWGGKPEKELTPGPLGPRLTPRGSFDEWKEIVRDSAEPWDATRLESARELLNALLRISNLRHAEIDRARTQLMAILGHDLRDPLNSINLAAHFLGQDEGDNDSKMGAIILNSSSRMQRLISQVLDMSRIGSGIGLSIEVTLVDVAYLIRTLIDEAQLAHPGMSYKIEMPDTLQWYANPDRLAQAVGNLLSNARHHGSPGTDVVLTVSNTDNLLTIDIRNEADEIDPLVAENLFSPFKKTSAQQRRSGLGLGLYIAKEIISGHGGNLNYYYETPHVIFKINLPDVNPNK